MSIAAGSASEVKYQLLLACNLNYIQDETYVELNQQVNEVRRMLNSVIKKPTAQVQYFCINSIQESVGAMEPEPKKQGSPGALLRLAGRHKGRVLCLK